jgi:PIN domain nuclease of toxin-antitoxin system
VILLDTHIWYWWVEKSPKLTEFQRRQMLKHKKHGLGVSIYSIWEIAKLQSAGKIKLKVPISDWVAGALDESGIRLLSFSKEVAIESANLPRPIHRDPADQILIATARHLDIPLLTADAKNSCVSSC